MDVAIVVINQLNQSAGRRSPHPASYQAKATISFDIQDGMFAEFTGVEVVLQSRHARSIHDHSSKSDGGGKDLHRGYQMPAALVFGKICLARCDCSL